MTITPKAEYEALVERLRAEVERAEDDLRRSIENTSRAIDLLAERTYGNPARSPAHNARIVLERAITIEPATPDPGDICSIYAKPMRPDDLCQMDIGLGTVHAACCGTDRDGYVHLADGTPLAADEPLPEPFRYGEPT